MAPHYETSLNRMTTRDHVESDDSCEHIEEFRKHHRRGAVERSKSPHCRCEGGGGFSMSEAAANFSLRFRVQSASQRGAGL